MQRMVQKLFSGFGSEMMLRHAGQDIPFRGLLQHTQSKSWQSMEKMFSPLGEIPRGQYTLYLPPQVEAQVGDLVIMDGKSYEIRRLDAMLYRDAPVYKRGLCTETGREDTWGMNC